MLSTGGQEKYTVQIAMETHTFISIRSTSTHLKFMRMSDLPGFCDAIQRRSNFRFPSLKPRVTKSESSINSNDS